MEYLRVTSYAGFFFFFFLWLVLMQGLGVTSIKKKILLDFKVFIFFLTST